MRVTDDRRAREAAGRETSARSRTAARSFGETLARVRGEGRAEADRRREAVAVGPRQTRAVSAGASARPERDAGPARPRPLGRDARDLLPAPRLDAAPAAAGPPPSDPPPLPPVRALVRAIPPAIDAARARAGEPLELSFGPALRLDLRAGRDGVEVTLRPDRRLFRAAAAELPGLVRALSARGIRVARARVEAALDRPDPAAGAVR